MWSWDTWQLITGVHHGFFNADDAKLPPGWSHLDAQNIKSFFFAYDAIPSEVNKVQFSTCSMATPHPGCKKWTDWVNKNYSKWDIHNKVVKQFNMHDCHLATVFLCQGRAKNIHNATAKWPKASSYIPEIVILFGNECLYPGTTTLSIEMKEGLIAISQRCWDSIRHRVQEMTRKPDLLQTRAEEALKGINAEKPTKTSISKVIKAIAKWKDSVILIGNQEDTEVAEQMLSPRHAPACVLKGMAMQEDIIKLKNVYHDFFKMNVDDDQAVLHILNPKLQKGLDARDGNIGVEMKAKMSPAELCQNLGFRPIKLPPQFYLHCHLIGLNNWDNPSAFDDESQHTDMSFHWHQLSGMHAAICKIFSCQPNPHHTTGILIADEVGLGKTAQAIGLLSFFNLVITVQASNHPVPPITCEFPYLRGNSKIPSLPHLILCPGMLIQQWIGEFKMLMRFKSINILVYNA
ncbi:hypothetical protein H0H87_001788 [Tephrocybe sp. NHM501043]|nr:hypothetical protein H0H87_001788 [Tephrocybe sp. NHM501043]